MGEEKNNCTWARIRKNCAQASMPDGYSASIYHSICEVKEHEWSTLVDRTNVYLSYSYLKILEANAPASMQPIYLLVKNKSGFPCFQAVLQLHHFRLPQQAAHNAQRPAYISLRNFLIDVFTRKSIRLLTIGNAFISGIPAYQIHHEVRAEQVMGWIELALEQIRATHQPDAVFLKDLDGNLEKCTKPSGYTAFATEPNMVLKLLEDWKTFSDYQDSLSSKYRKNQKALEVKKAPLREHNFALADLKEFEHEIDKLYSAVFKQAKFGLGKMRPGYFAAMKEKFPDTFFVKGYFEGNQLVAFMSYTLLGDMLDAHFIGLDYAKNKTFGLYANILYDYLKVALENGCRTVNYNRTAAEIKSNVGALPQQLCCCIRLVNPISNHLMRPVFDRMKADPFVLRKPFKTFEAGLEKAASTAV